LIRKYEYSPYVNITTDHEYILSRKPFLSSAMQLPTIKKEKKISYEKIDKVDFREKKDVKFEKQ